MDPQLLQLLQGGNIDPNTLAQLLQGLSSTGNPSSALNMLPVPPGSTGAIAPALTNNSIPGYVSPGSIDQSRAAAAPAPAGPTVGAQVMPPSNPLPIKGPSGIPLPAAATGQSPATTSNLETQPTVINDVDPGSMPQNSTPGFPSPAAATQTAAGNMGVTADPSAALANPFPTDLSNIPQTPQINLGTMPTNSTTFGSDVLGQYGANTSATGQQIAGAYGGQFPTMQAAQLDLSQLPQLTPTLANQSSALQFLLSGQGYDPATLAAMNAGVTDNAANAGLSARSSDRIAAEQAGIAGSPAAMALESNANRDQAASTQQGLNQVQIQNAQQGMQNLTAGAGLENSRQLTNSQMANTMALQSAQNIIQGMNQNVANTQAANSTNFQGQQQKAMGSAQDQSNFAANQGSALNSAVLGKASNADTQNTNNANAWALNQANLDQNNNQFNVNTGENRWKSSLDALSQLTQGTQGLGYSTLGTDALSATTPGASAAGTALSNAGNAILASQITPTTPTKTVATS